MPKKATKAAGNVFYEARTEAAKCNDELSSREGAAGWLGIDRTRLARIELGSLIPYPEEVLLMAEAYNSPELNNRYCCKMCPIGKHTIPEIEMLQLDHLVIQILASLQRAEGVDRTMIEVVADGRVRREDWPKIKKVLSALEEVLRATMAMKMWVDKNLPYQDEGKTGGC